MQSQYGQYGLALSEEEISKFLLAEVEPVFHCLTGEKSYRAAARLSHGVYFPCVEFKSASQLVDHAIRRFNEARDGLTRCTYREMVHLQLCVHNMISPYCIEGVEQSPYALPVKNKELLHDSFDALGLDIYGNYLPFIAVMDDGKKFCFAYNPETNFLNLPDGYTADQIIEVIPNRKLPQKLYGTRLPFACYLSTL
jgi:hypothetical protein